MIRVADPPEAKTVKFFFQSLCVFNMLWILNELQHRTPICNSVVLNLVGKFEVAMT